ncbi:hypothetical protein BU15DRAFT_67413 [Melanogaster broomeanus]|nr:hypothetical protein BU15DRAFT_67413 [Melanogaster broomeanus]
MEADTTSKSAVAEAQARIDDQIALLRLPICALLTRRNALSPASRLPPHVLANIFLYQAYSFYQDPGYSHTSGPPPWANVSYTCHHWRNVALSCPSLWSFLFMSSPRWTEELLSRTKMVPLRIRIDVGCSTQEEMMFFEKVTTDVTRIQDLSLKLPHNLAEWIFSKLSTPASLLHTLCLFVIKTDAESVLVPDTLFNRDTPALRTLELYRCHIPCSSPILTSLTSLRLRDVASSSQPTIPELLAMLRHIPDLAHLYLENALSGAEDILASQHGLLSACLDLPHLSRLALVAPFSAIVAFLSNVTVLATTELRLCCRNDVEPTESYSQLYPLLERIFNATSDVGPVIRTLNIKTTTDDVGFVLSTSERDCHVPFYSVHGQCHLYEDWGCGIPLKLDIEFESTSWECQGQLMGNICRTIPLVHLHTLAHFSITYEWGDLPPSFLETTFGNLQELRFIKLIQLHMNDWIPALSPAFCQDVRRVKGTKDIFAPALAELHVTGVTFEYDCWSRREGVPCEGSVRCLYQALANRTAEGYPLKKLVVAGSSYVSSAQVEALRDVVDEVDWDGYPWASSSSGSGSSDDEDEF